MAKSETRVITKWKVQLKKLQDRKTMALSSGVITSRLDNSIKDLKTKLTHTGVSVESL